MGFYDKPEDLVARALEEHVLDFLDDLDVSDLALVSIAFSLRSLNEHLDGVNRALWSLEDK